MGTEDRNARRTERKPWLAPAVVFVVGLIWVHTGAAAAVSSGFDAVEHAKYCSCGSKCRKAACCCGPREAKVASATPRRIIQTPALSTSRLCMTSAPCGEKGLPTSRSIGPEGKPATLSVMGRPSVRASRDLFPGEARCVLPPRRASRLDKPPEDRDAA